MSDDAQALYIKIPFHTERVSSAPVGLIALLGLEGKCRHLRLIHETQDETNRRSRSICGGRLNAARSIDDLNDLQATRHSCFSRLRLPRAPEPISYLHRTPSRLPSA